MPDLNHEQSEQNSDISPLPPIPAEGLVQGRRGDFSEEICTRFWTAKHINQLVVAAQSFLGLIDDGPHDIFSIGHSPSYITYATSLLADQQTNKNTTLTFNYVPFSGRSLQLEGVYGVYYLNDNQGRLLQRNFHRYESGFIPGGLEYKIQEIYLGYKEQIDKNKKFYLEYISRDFGLDTQKIVKKYREQGTIAVMTDIVQQGESFATFINLLCENADSHGILSEFIQASKIITFRDSKAHNVDAIIIPATNILIGITTLLITTSLSSCIAGNFRNDCDRFVTQYVPKDWHTEPRQPSPDALELPNTIKRYIREAIRQDHTP